MTAEEKLKELFVPCILNHNRYCEIRFENYCYGCTLYSETTDEKRAEIDTLLEAYRPNS